MSAMFVDIIRASIHDRDRNNNRNDNKPRARIFGSNPAAYREQHKAHGCSADCFVRKQMEKKEGGRTDRD